MIMYNNDDDDDDDSDRDRKNYFNIIDHNDTKYDVLLSFYKFYYYRKGE